MPGDFKDKEQWIPYHHDPLYNLGPNQFEPRLEPVDNFIQSVAVEVLGRKLEKGYLEKVKRHLHGNGFLYRNWGDPAFHDEVCKYLKTLSMARKVARRCQI